VLEVGRASWARHDHAVISGWHPPPGAGWSAPEIGLGLAAHHAV